MKNSKAKEKILPLDDVFYPIVKKHSYRYERKFTIPNIQSFSNVELSIKRNKALFREVFHVRRVNNIYLDTPAFNHYFDNVLGVSDRKKIRVRWYDDIFGRISKPVLEIKIKKGLVGDKWSYNLDPFTLDNNFTAKNLIEVFKKSNLPEPILESIQTLRPTLLNSYKRKYYLSANNKFRTTLDFDLSYYKIDVRMNNFNFKPLFDENMVVELKYEISDDDDSNEITTLFPFRLSKNSKYVNGLNSSKQFPQ